MNKRIHSSWLLITLALLVGMVVSGARLNAQQTAQQPDSQSSSQSAGQQTEPQTQPPPDQQSPSQAGQQSQPPAQQQAPDQSGKQAPDTQAQSQTTQGQIFAGTVVKSGDKFMLQDASGTSYDIDRQDLVKKYEGKQVRVNGTLDPDGKTIHVK